MDVKKIPIILRFKLSALPSAKITSEVKKVENKIKKLTNDGKNEDEVSKEIGDIDKLANKILEDNNVKINIIKKPVVKENIEELPKDEPVLKIPEKDLTEDEKRVAEMKNRLKKSMNSSAGVSTADEETGETVEERVASKEFTKEILEDQVTDKSAHTFISAGKNDKAALSKATAGWIFIGSWALPLFELMHLLVLSSPFFIIYMLIYLPLFGTSSFASYEGQALIMLSLALSIIGPVVFYYASRPFLHISAWLFKLTDKVVDTKMSITQKNNPFMFVLNHKRMLTTIVAIAALAAIGVVTFSVLSESNIIDIINNNF